MVENNLSTTGKKKATASGFALRTIYYLAILITLALIYGLQGMNAAPFIYAEF
ncbi:teichoic acid D-Ala incorporation-associated protein DltX [Heyndrickxia acidicola]|uniref:Teichoic acid D-Ala incorporation-associated protein DltX n=1 Tax=Heyndrickxia acidicola TaxID=209389 RepID=A0ABU6MEG4_9BACI|nr:teichoic acid D-Ala incorporation-associated protein DltX [Heyndrickxia acidicola]MED1202818.1 teichoic acid D-Ala incorporation-associated protein DltX [Heyndrickxia acidicola]